MSHRIRLLVLSAIAAAFVTLAAGSVLVGAQSRPAVAASGAAPGVLLRPARVFDAVTEQPHDGWAPADSPAWLACTVRRIRCACLSKWSGRRSP